MGLYRFLRQPRNSADLIIRLQMCLSAIPWPFHGSVYVDGTSQSVHLNVPGFSHFHIPFTGHNFPSNFWKEWGYAVYIFSSRYSLLINLPVIQIYPSLSVGTEEEMSNICSKRILLIMLLIPVPTASSRIVFSHLLLLRIQYHPWLQLASAFPAAFEHRSHFYLGVEDSRHLTLVQFFS